ncbi:hypothetical Protein YC6258_02863 [Gynuella sunshinyii YC6258]|uniref:Uncharacterized protein n=1 Tax=Gynuella sunshinyii YC6258 TaxID=1445510 RepID=A0A0C5VKS0_9GAMM|nr:hypothetical Protein YC6258_02863 [Gynuella sunshinyii YC6258]
MNTFTNTVKTFLFSSIVISVVSGCQVEITTTEVRSLALEMSLMTRMTAPIMAQFPIMTMITMVF